MPQFVCVFPEALAIRIPVKFAMRIPVTLAMRIPVELEIRTPEFDFVFFVEVQLCLVSRVVPALRSLMRRPEFANVVPTVRTTIIVTAVNKFFIFVFSCY